MAGVPHESVSDVDQLPWGKTLRQRLTEQGIALRSACSIGDHAHWHLRVAWPESLRDRFGITRQGLILACHGSIEIRQVSRAQDVLRLAGALATGRDAELDPELLIIIDDQPDLAARLEGMAGRTGQWVPWPAPEFADLSNILAGNLRRHDIFDMNTPARGRQFFGRENVKADITRRVLHGESVGIFGLRKSGKTSLARAVTDAIDPVSLAVSYPGSIATVDAASRAHVVWLDVQSVHERTEHALWRELRERITSRMRASGVDIEQTDDVYRDVETTFRKILNNDTEPTALCVVLDEYDLLFARSGYHPARLLGLLRGLAQETGRLSVIFIGRDREFLAASQLDGAPNPVHGWVHDYWTGGIEPAFADELLIVLGKRVGLRIGPNTCEIARTWTGGFVRMLRHFGSALVEVARRQFSDTEDVDTDRLDRDVVIEQYLDKDSVADRHREAFELLQSHYKPSYALLCALLGCKTTEDRTAALADRGGWSGMPARKLRNFGLLVGLSRAPKLLHWVESYGLEVLQVGLAPDRTMGQAVKK